MTISLLLSGAPFVLALAGCGGGGSGSTLNPTATPTPTVFSLTAPAPLVPSNRSGVLLEDSAQTTQQLFNPSQNRVASATFSPVNFSPDGREFLFSQTVLRDAGKRLGFYQSVSGTTTGRFIGELYLPDLAYTDYANTPLSLANNGRVLTVTGGGKYARSASYQVRNESGTLWKFDSLLADQSILSPDGTRVYATSGTSIVQVSPHGNTTLFTGNALSDLRLNAQGNVLSVISTTQTNDPSVAVTSSVYLINTQSSSGTPITIGGLGAATGSTFRQQLVSPDGSQLLYELTSTDGTRAFYLVSLASKSQKKLDIPAGSTLVRWLP